MNFLKKTEKPVTVEITAKANAHQGEEQKTIDAVKEILEKATPEEIAVLQKLINSPRRKWAMSFADKL